jgi:hypothetical protein
MLWHRHSIKHRFSPKKSLGILCGLSEFVVLANPSDLGGVGVVSEKFLTKYSFIIEYGHAYLTTNLFVIQNQSKGLWW